jgi:hypothetical protein
MASWVSIANRALRRCGNTRIQSLDDKVEAARAVKDVYEEARDDVLAAHPWNCNKADTHLAADADAPDSGFTYAYTVPTDPYCLKVWSLDYDHHGEAEWEVKGRKIHTDEAAPLYIHYGKRITDPEEFPPFIVKAIAEAIAARIAFRLTNSTSREEKCEEYAEKALRDARSADAQEGKAKEDLDSDWLDSRN